MAGTKKFIRASVGVGGKNQWGDVIALQELLIAAGQNVPGGADGRWGNNSTIALQSLLRTLTPPVAKTYIDKALVQPTDDIPLQLAKKADILIPLPNVRGIGGVDKVHQWCVENDIAYQPGAESGGGNRCIYGVDGRTDYAVQTEDRKFKKGPIQLDCTTYANLILSIYIYGNAHNSAYDGDCERVGGTSKFHCARDRYGLPIVSRKDKDKNGKEVTLTDFRTAEQITAATKAKGGLYALEAAELGSGFVRHLALLWGSNVYECTNVFDPSCVKHPLREFMERCRRLRRFCYLFGPR